MEPTHPPVTLEEAREAVELYVRSTRWLRRDLAKTLPIASFERSGSFHIRARWFTETRGTQATHEPFRGQPVDGANYGAPPAPWDMPVRLPGVFVNQDHMERVPHTDEVRPCHICHASGQITCPRCSGQRRITCSHCSGSGSVTRTRTLTRTNSQGQSETYHETYTESCGPCGGDGKVTCPECYGNGQITCPTCQGARQLKHFLQLLVAWKTHVADKVIEKSDLPDHLISGAQGDIIHAEEDDRLEPMSSGGGPGGGPYRGGAERVNPEVNEECNRLLGAFRLPNGTKLHRQSLHVRSVPVYEARYPWGKDTRRFWIYGHDKNVHAPDYPRSIVRIGLAIGIPILLLLVPVLYLLVGTPNVR
ncbi:MAG: hypothetical protein U0441_19085 [Polyangiaceae bacterium]